MPKLPATLSLCLCASVASALAVGEPSALTRPLTRANAEELVATTRQTPTHALLASRAGDYALTLTLTDAQGRSETASGRARAASILQGRYLDVDLHTEPSSAGQAALNARVVLGMSGVKDAPELLWVDAQGGSLRPIPGKLDATGRVMTFLVTPSAPGDVDAVVVTLTDTAGIRIEFRGSPSNGPSVVLIGAELTRPVP